MAQTAFLDRLKDRLDRWDLPAGPWLVGISGGPDSVALLRGLAELQRPGVQLVAAHLNHGLRGDLARRDEQFVKHLADHLGIPLEVQCRDVARQARQRGLSLESAARECRYGFFRQAAGKWKAGVLALGHTADDQAETILHRVVRGTGVAGLAGMPARRPLAPGCLLIRPLLDCWRTEILTYLQAIGQPFCRDETNDQFRHTRNRLRGDLLPKLEAEYNPRVRAALVRLGRLAADVQAVVCEGVSSLLEQVVVEQSPTGCVVRTTPLADCPPHLVRELLLRLWQQQGWPLRKMGYDQLDRLARLAQQGGPALTLPGNINARCEGPLLCLISRANEVAGKGPETGSERGQIRVGGGTFGRIKAD